MGAGNCAAACTNRNQMQFCWSCGSRQTLFEYHNLGAINRRPRVTEVVSSGRSADIVSSDNRRFCSGAESSVSAVDVQIIQDHEVGLS